MSNPNILSVENLTFADREEIVDVFADAFQDYPCMRYMIGREYDESDSHLRAILGFYTDKRLMRDLPVLGVRENGSLMAACLVSVPTETTEPDSSELEARLKEVVGEASISRIEQFENASDSMEPEEPHHFIGILGVRRSAQGNGYGRMIVQRVKEIAQSADSPGICLSTEDPNNLTVYKRLGFSVIGETDVGELHSWCLLWKNE